MGKADIITLVFTYILPVKYFLILKITYDGEFVYIVFSLYSAIMLI